MHCRSSFKSRLFFSLCVLLCWQCVYNCAFCWLCSCWPTIVCGGGKSVWWGGALLRQEDSSNEDSPLSETSGFWPSCLSLPLYGSETEPGVAWEQSGMQERGKSWGQTSSSSFPGQPIGLVHNCANLLWESLRSGFWHALLKPVLQGKMFSLCFHLFTPQSCPRVGGAAAGFFNAAMS